MQLKEIINYLNQYFFLSNFSFDPSQNGLQVEAENDEIKHIATSVDACMEALESASKIPAQLLIVHHGMFWGKSLLITGSHGKRISFLLKNNISLYALHLPLDVHPKLGNNALLAKGLNLKVVKPFGKYHNYEIGLCTETQKNTTRENLVKKVKQFLNTEVMVWPFGPENIEQAAVVSGGGMSELQRAYEEGYTTFLTGEGGHTYFHQAKELKMNVILAGHYASETLGVRALGNHLEKKFNLQHTFLDIPTGL